ncbi:MAG TPA: alkaline phosphatase family protein [Acetobacteraceae bacterium]|nr:alkaline phosphatase family protein [Acetobacteraceae bacterium]
MKRAVVVILDGLRRDFVDRERTPRLAAFAAQAQRFPGFRTAFPSATRAVSASFATGCHPARHTLQGNAVALLENGVLVPHDVGRPDFLAHKRALTGHALAVPTLAEHLALHGGAIVFNNVSPGAASAHDPDAFGHLYHRVISRGPGGAQVADPLCVTLDAAGDRAMTERFIAEPLPRRPALAVLWLGEPDHIQHETPLGSPQHLAVLREADRNAGAVIDAVARQRADGDDVLLLIGSDHGHETVSGSVDVEEELIAGGLKQAADSTDVIALSNGTATLVYLHPDYQSRRARLEDFLHSRKWAGIVVPAAELGTIGQAPHHGLAFAVSLRADDATNEFGVPGRALAAVPRWDKPVRVGCGQHGGLARYEQSPVLMIEGPGFAGGTESSRAAHIVDLAPTILHHIGVPATDLDGQSLQAAGP